MVLQASPTLTKMKDALFAALGTAPYGTVFPYQALSEIMGVDAVGHRYVILTVAKRLEREAQRALESIRGHGYRIAMPKDHLHLGSKRHLRGRRQIDGALRVLKATPLQALSPEERRRHDAFLLLLHQQADVLRSVKVAVQEAHMTVDSLVDRRLQEAMDRIKALEQRQ